MSVHDTDKANSRHGGHHSHAVVIKRGVAGLRAAHLLAEKLERVTQRAMEWLQGKSLLKPVSNLYVLDTGDTSIGAPPMHL